MLGVDNSDGLFSIIAFPQTFSIGSKSQIDPDVFKSMSSLGCFKDKQALTSALLNSELV